MRAIAIVLIIALAIALLPKLLQIRSPPAIHDEFAYLLQADTFARGRLSNPAHPHWQFFETLHVLNQPTYAAKFPPGQGMMLAVGQKLGDPAYGAILAVAIACAATTWMIGAFVPARWALLGGLIAASHPLVFSWAQSFWGGGVGMIGGALALGALGRMLRRARGRDGIALGVGIATMLNSRPFEGALLIGVAIVAAAIIFRQRRVIRARPRGFARSAAMAGAILAGAMCWMAYYNFRVTGKPLRLADVEYTMQYMAAPRFWWMPGRPERRYRHGAMEAFHRGSEYREYQSQLTQSGFAAAQGRKFRELFYDWFARPPMASLLLLPAIAIGVLRFRRARWIAAVILCVPVVEMLSTPWFRPHYMSVIAPAIFAAATIGLLVIHRRSRAVGRGIVAVILAGQLAATGWIVREMIVHPNVAAMPRHSLIQRLERIPGKHLVFIAYDGPGRTILEWVYNSADIDGQRIVFARDMGPEKNMELKAYYADRAAWSVTVRGFECTMQPATN